MPYVYVEDSWDDFRVRQNCAYLQTPDRLFRFANGAVTDADQVFAEPPEDQVERLTLQVIYLEERAKVARSRFKRIQSFIADQGDLARAGAGPAPDEMEPTCYADLNTADEALQKAEELLAEKKRELSALQHDPNSYAEYQRKLRNRGKAAIDRAFTRP